MITKTQKTFATAVGTGVAFLLLNLASGMRRPDQLQATTPKTAVNAFKNIQVLKDIPADQLIPSMQFITASLGVECDFCHVEGAFEKDDKKPKQMARKMIQMMFAINKDNFGDHREITCYSCHRRQRLQPALEYFSPERLLLTSECGFGHVPLDITRQKIEVLTETCRELRKHTPMPSAG